jgi:hypothetical protein
MVAEKRVLADKLRQDKELLERTRQEAAAKLAAMPASAKGVRAKRRVGPWPWVGAAVATAGAGLLLLRRRS